MEENQTPPISYEQVSATHAARNFAEVRQHARAGPVIISSHNRDRQVLLEYDLYQRLIQQESDPDMAERLNAKLMLTLESVDTYICIMDGHCHVRRVNGSLLAALERDSESIVGSHIKRVFTDSSFSYVIERIDEVIETKIAARFEQASPINPDRMLSFRIKPWPGGVSLFADDITDKTILREERLGTAARGVALEMFGDIGRGSINSNGTITEASPTFARQVGVSPTALAGKRFLALFSPESRADVEAAIQSTVEAQLLEAQYLAGGVKSKPCQLSLATFWNGVSGHSHAFFMRDI